MALSARRFEYDSIDEDGRSPRDSFKLVRGRARSGENKAIAPSSNPQLIKLVIGVVVALCIVGIVRVAISVQTVSTLMVNKELTASVETARSAGNDLEIQYSVYANPTRVREVATGSLGMVMPSRVAQLDVTGSADIERLKSVEGQMYASNQSGIAE